jgi:predicted kinase
MFVLIGLPAAGKTTRARQLEIDYDALRLTPDEWMFPLFGDPQPEGKRDILEGRLVSLSLWALRRGVNVVMDFGVWARDERSALRHLAESVGASCELIYVEIGEEENIKRITERPTGAAVSTFEISIGDLAKYRAFFQVPTIEELNGGTYDGAPSPFHGWEAWAKDRWPGLTTD